MEKSMAFPPEFSSTATYENRYDLNEIDVFLEGNFSNPMFFNISGIPQNLSFGKHYFNLSILDSSNQEYELRPNSKILFEFKSINNVILRSDVVELNQLNGVATCFVEVLEDPLRTYEEVKDGQGTLTIVGSLQDKENTENPISEKFAGAMNYRCIFPINIAKNLLNADSPIVTNTTHKKTTLKGQFSFVKANISPLRTSDKGLTYTADGAPAGAVTPESQTENPN
tara:strand:+ start:36 stop:713 length:678 start_codon:yes stop_codon:yes gene_type:complete